MSRYPSTFPRIDWTASSGISLPPFPASKSDQELQWAARAASRAWARGDVAELDWQAQLAAFRLATLDKTLEWRVPVHVQSYSASSRSVAEEECGAEDDPRPVSGHSVISY